MTTIKQNVTAYYNWLDNNSKVLLDPATSSTQKQQAINSISRWSVYTWVSIAKKTYDTLPNQSQTTGSILLLQNKAKELRNEVNLLQIDKNTKE